MRKSAVLLPAVKAEILSLKGKPIRLTVHDGRQKYRRYTGVVDAVYPAVFTVLIDGDPSAPSRMSWSYSDLLCGDVRIGPIAKRSAR